MKVIISFVIFINIMFSMQALAECTANRNANITITKPDSIYTDHGNGTVTDSNTGLMWKKCSLGLSGSSCASGTVLTFTWQAALSAANNNTDSGYSDWRLPNKNELESLIENACSNTAINHTFFPATVALSSTDAYWSSSQFVPVSNASWNINFKYGEAKGSYKNSNYYVRLVRNSP